ncbi:type I methionyl aminopeptidase [Candidatus Gracilibacteria bacterium]|nr:type I methionyl aminopeptidase [Candidatus Gracilibacteria bacterium]MCF7856409.1 type I methionyl aminopeptidase [Candidatus Gracilibacteria bacterium]MCF7896282.1 type I methionyl aminopeptidase [Candidatus Gracilibacteria bacterium]
MSIVLKTPAELEIIRHACRIQSEILNQVCAAVEPGISTTELDAMAENLCHKRNVIPAFKNYQGFPATICASVNDQVVHGIPSPNKILRNGDIVSIDFGVILENFYADACRTVPVGAITETATKLVERTKESLYHGIAAARAGNTTGDIGHAVEGFVRQFGYSPVRETVGHGIGRKLHEDPEVPNFGKPGTGVELKAGMTICIEPIINLGKAEILTEKDGWTTRTTDGKLSAHFEHQILMTEDEPEILTTWDE